MASLPAPLAATRLRPRRRIPTGATRTVVAIPIGASRGVAVRPAATRPRRRVRIVTIRIVTTRVEVAPLAAIRPRPRNRRTRAVDARAEVSPREVDRGIRMVAVPATTTRTGRGRASIVAATRTTSSAAGLPVLRRAATARVHRRARLPRVRPVVAASPATATASPATATHGRATHGAVPRQCGRTTPTCTSRRLSVRAGSPLGRAGVHRSGIPTVTVPPGREQRIRTSAPGRTP